MTQQSTDDRILFAIKDNRAVPFDPVVRAGLSQAQINRMQELLVAVSDLKDNNGLRIIFDIDFWIAAQLTAALYDIYGNAKQFKGPELQ